ncbi:TIM barrel protein [Catenulispora rubra]|uniref:TIM barrel protein n=1 Tax=Catenulispora rubra TaxID=280293 RepID=UPI0018926324|nr:TIM barrel protein [Catenulispora rubra]
MSDGSGPGPAVPDGVLWGYGTNGFGNHRLEEALRIIADLGYRGVALTLDSHHLDPFAPDASAKVGQVAALLDRLELAVVIETGARYLLDPRRKHQPSLVSPEAERRLRLMDRACAIAGDLNAQAVSFWSGVDHDDDPDEAWDRLRENTARVVGYADTYGVTLGLEPEPGMVVQTLDDYEALLLDLGCPQRLGLTLDVGHCRAVEEQPVPECVLRAAPRLVNVQIDDMVRGVHEHLEFGAGEIDFPPVIAALIDSGYSGLVGVELPRHSHAAPEVARRSLEFLRAATPASQTSQTSQAPPTPTIQTTSAEALRHELEAHLDSRAAAWLDSAVAEIAADADRCAVHSAGAARRCGRAPLTARWSVDEAVRALLLYAVPAERRAEVLWDVYTRGDPAERRAALKALPLLPGLAVGSGRALVEDALRTNDATLITAALGPYAAAHLEPDALRQAVLKCAFLSVPFSAVPEVIALADAELAALLSDYARERVLAGRDVDDQILDLIAAQPSRARTDLSTQLADLVREPDERARFRSEAARRAADRLAAGAGTS